MSYMLEFPPSELPQDVFSPPYVLFGINGVDTFSRIPTTIPLALVLHFAPILRRWVLPQPKLSRSATRMALRTPFVGIDIIADIEVEGLGYVLARMMQAANLKMPPGDYTTFKFNPGLLTSISIHKAWMALELPPSGIAGLHYHIQMTLISGPPVYLLEVKALWHSFPLGTPMLLYMGFNFARNYVAKRYTPQECSTIRHWYLETTERWNFFRRIEQMFPEWDDVQRDTIKATGERHRRELELQKLFKQVPEAEANKVQVKTERSQNMKHGQRVLVRKQERKTSSGSTSSNSSVNTTIWNPASTGSRSESPATPSSDFGEPSASLSKPVDSSDLIHMLKNMVIQNKLQDMDTKSKKPTKGQDTAPVGPTSNVHSKARELSPEEEKQHKIEQYMRRYGHFKSRCMPVSGDTTVIAGHPLNKEAGKALDTPYTPWKPTTSGELGLNSGGFLGTKTYVPPKTMTSTKRQNMNPSYEEKFNTTAYVRPKSRTSRDTVRSEGEVLGATTYVPPSSTKTAKSLETTQDVSQTRSAAAYIPSTSAKPQSNGPGAGQMLNATAYVPPTTSRVVKSNKTDRDTAGLLNAAAYVPPKSSKIVRSQGTSLTTEGLLSAATSVPPKSTNTAKLRETNHDTGSLLSATTYQPYTPTSSTPKVQAEHSLHPGHRSEKPKSHPTLNNQATRDLVTKALATTAEVLTPTAPKVQAQVRAQDFAQVDANGIRSIDFATVHAAQNPAPTWTGPPLASMQKRKRRLEELRAAELKASELAEEASVSQRAGENAVACEGSKGSGESAGAVDGGRGGEGGGILYLSSSVYRP